MFFKTIIGIIIPFIGTVIGSAGVLIINKNHNDKIKMILSAFAGGIMLAASIWSLIIPSVEYRDDIILSFAETSAGFITGLVFMISSEGIIDKSPYRKGIFISNKDTLLQFVAVTVHNIPEGLAVGLVFASYLTSEGYPSFLSAIVFSIGIALQNIPEGAIVSMPLYADGTKKRKAFFLGSLSGAVEPISAIFSILAFSCVEIFLPFMLSFAAGAMVFVVIKQLIPEMYSQEDKLNNICVLLFGAGFLVMMGLDIITG